MIRVSKLSSVILTLILIGFISPNAQAGDGLLARLRDKICNAKQALAYKCCIKKVHETYCRQVKIAERDRCINEDLYNYEMCLAKMAYCQGLEECRNPCCQQTMASAPGAVAGQVPSRACIIAYFACREAGVPPNTCRENLLACDAPIENGLQQY